MQTSSDVSPAVTRLFISGCAGLAQGSEHLQLQVAQAQHVYEYEYD